MAIQVKKVLVSGKITKFHKDGSVVEKAVPYSEPSVPDHPCVVSVMMNMTRNLGNYESLKIGVSLSVPCPPELVDETYTDVKAWVDGKLNEVNQEVNENLQ